MNYAIILAGGSGSRFGSEIPKQFSKLNNREMLSISVDTFYNHPKIDQIVIVSHKDWLHHVVTNYSDCIVVEGGARRQDSSLKGVQATSRDTENVLIHDAARPFVSPRIISDCLESLKKYAGTAPIMDISNSLIQLDNGIPAYVDRSKIREVQTPQCFKRTLILRVLSEKLEATDEIGMVLRKFPEIKLQFVQGSDKNSKITTAIDLQLFRKP